MDGDVFYEKATTSKVELDLLRFCYELTVPPEKWKIKKQCTIHLILTGTGNILSLLLDSYFLTFGPR